MKIAASAENKYTTKSTMNEARRRRERSSFALVITLLAVLLISSLIVAFLSSALFKRQIAYSSTNQIKSELLCHSALDIILGELREEIRTGSTAATGGSSSYPVVYLPLGSTNLVPQTNGVSSPDAIGATTLLKVSANNTPINANSGGRIVGSSISTATPSLNGRLLSATTWFGTSGPQLGTQSTLPTWVFLTRDNSIVTSPNYASPPTTPSYVIGRFAYAIYDIGGLLNANVAGYLPTALTWTAGNHSSSRLFLARPPCTRMAPHHFEC